MKIVVIGGSGLIGKKLVKRLQGAGHQATMRYQGRTATSAGTPAAAQSAASSARV